MTGPAWRALAIAALLLLVLPAVAGAQAAGTDPAVAALSIRDVYVSPRVLGPAAAAEERTLSEVAEALREDGRPVKLAVVYGPVGAPSLEAYAERLAARLGHPGAVVVTRPGGEIAAATGRGGIGPRARLDDPALVGIANPAQRLALAARRAAVRVDLGEDDGPSATLILVLMALLGGGWAAAMGTGRAGREGRRRLTESRAHLRVLLDAVRSRAAHLARLPDLSDDDRARVEGALGTYAEAIAALQQAATPNDVEALAPRVGDALDALATVAADVGEPFAPDRPFEGLCSADPGHGLAAGDGPVEGLDRPVPLCTACLEAGASGRPPVRRLLPRAGRPVPFDEASPATGAAGGVRASPG